MTSLTRESNLLKLVILDEIVNSIVVNETSMSGHTSVHTNTNVETF